MAILLQTWRCGTIILFQNSCPTNPLLKESTMPIYEDHKEVVLELAIASRSL